MKEARGSVHLSRSRTDAERHVLSQWELGGQISKVLTLGGSAVLFVAGVAGRSVDTVLMSLDTAQFDLGMGLTGKTTGFEVVLKLVGQPWRYEFADSGEGGVDVSVALIYPGWEGRLVPQRLLDTSVRRYLDGLTKWAARRP